MPEHDYITKQEERMHTSNIRSLLLAAACCLLILVSLSGWYIGNKTSESIITLDVNPSIEIRTNHKNHILSVTALNNDAGIVLEDCNYSGKKLKEMLPAIMNSLVKHQYLNTDKNTILLTVMNKNGKKADAILNETASAIEESLKTSNINPTIMKQVITADKKRSVLAKQYHISEGRMRLIQQLAALSERFTIDALAKLPIQKLYDLAKENSMDLSGYLSEEDKAVNPVQDKAGTVPQQKDSKAFEEKQSGHGKNNADYRKKDKKSDLEGSDYENSNDREDTDDIKKDDWEERNQNKKETDDDDKYHWEGSSGNTGNNDRYIRKNSSEDQDSENRSTGESSYKDQDNESRSTKEGSYEDQDSDSRNTGEGSYEDQDSDSQNTGESSYVDQNSENQSTGEGSYVDQSSENQNIGEDRSWVHDSESQNSGEGSNWD
jgi:hypothetical protein